MKNNLMTRAITKVIATVALAATMLVAVSMSYADGKSDYEAMCFACHGFGVAGAPKLGDKDAWKERIAAGLEKLYDNAINGYTGDAGVMPPKGGFANLSDQQVKDAVDYMVEAAVESAQ